MGTTPDNVLDVLGGNRELQVGLEAKDMAMLAGSVFVGMLLALIVYRLLFGSNA